MTQKRFMKGENIFTAKEFMYSLDCDRRESASRIIKDLKDSGYIGVIGEQPQIYKYLLNDKGKEMVKQILEELKNINIDDYNLILSQVKLLP